MQGKVIKIFSDFYYIQTEQGIIEAKIRENIKKSGLQVLVGDNVELEDFNSDTMQAAIGNILERKNFLIRPSVANIDLIILVVSLSHPKTPYNNIDRYLAQAKYFNHDVLICVNKSDLSTNEAKEEFNNIYKKLGYEIVFTSAKTKAGICDLEKYLESKTSILCGASGVGKSSLCNVLQDDFILRTGKNSKNTRGTHTTRHCEIIPITNNGNIVDTPGFSLLKFDYIEPARVKEFFPEIELLSQECKFSDCLHINELGCNVLNNLDKIAKSRYESYLDILKEAKEYKTRVQKEGKKSESKSKKINEKYVPKISAKNRDNSRRKTKQLLNSQFGE